MWAWRCCCSPLVVSKAARKLIRHCFGTESVLFNVHFVYIIIIDAHLESQGPSYRVICRQHFKARPDQSPWCHELGLRVHLLRHVATLRPVRRRAAHGAGHGRCTEGNDPGVRAVGLHSGQLLPGSSGLAALMAEILAGAQVVSMTGQLTCPACLRSTCSTRAARLLSAQRDACTTACRRSPRPTAT